MVTTALLGPAAPGHASPSTAPNPSKAQVRVLAWNIFHGGKDAGLGGEANLRRVLDQVVATAPDVFFAVETYGSADAIRTALTDRAGKGAYSATQVTSGSSDNLWIFTRYPVTKVYPKPKGSTVTDFNLGGIRAALPNGREVNFFDTWLSYTDPWIGDMIDANAAAVAAGRTPPYSAASVRDAEGGAQVPQIQNIIKQQLPYMLAGNSDPVVIGGDFNTVPAGDWATNWSGCTHHFGLSYDLRATEVVTDAGFTDTFRAAHPDVCTAPGRTWSPLPEYGNMLTKDRIDFIFAKGAGVSVRDSHTLDQRLPHHGPGPFYSDHAAVVTDLEFGAGGSAG